MMRLHLSMAAGFPAGRALSFVPADYLPRAQSSSALRLFPECGRRSRFFICESARAPFFGVEPPWVRRERLGYALRLYLKKERFESWLSCNHSCLLHMCSCEVTRSRLERCPLRVRSALVSDRCFALCVVPLDGAAAEMFQMCFGERSWRMLTC